MKSLRVHFWIVTMAAFALAGCVSGSLQLFLQEKETAMTERFDFVSIDAFLRRVIAAHSAVDGVSLVSAHIGSRWHMVERDYPNLMRSGRWVLDDRSRKEEFSLCYELTGKRVIVVRAKRISRTEFEELGVSMEFVVSATLGLSGAPPPPIPTSEKCPVRKLQPVGQLTITPT